MRFENNSSKSSVEIPSDGHTEGFGFDPRVRNNDFRRYVHIKSFAPCFGRHVKLSVPEIMNLFKLMI